MTSFIFLWTKLPLLFQRPDLILDLYESLLADVCQQERHTEGDQNVRDKKEHYLLKREDSKE
jgi:hypothetical protein